MSLSPTHIVLMLVASGFVTPPIVLLIPHARQSPLFDRLLWAGTFVTAFLGTWLGIANWSNAIPEPSLNSVPIIPIVAGAMGGAIALNAILWSLDRLERLPDEEEIPPPEDEVAPGPETRTEAREE